MISEEKGLSVMSSRRKGMDFRLTPREPQGADDGGIEDNDSRPERDERVDEGDTVRSTLGCADVPSSGERAIDGACAKAETWDTVPSGGLEVVGGSFGTSTRGMPFGDA